VHFASIQFAYFLAVTLTVASLLRGRPVAHKAFLTAASYVFYAKLSIPPMLLLFASSLVNYGLGEAMDRATKVRHRKYLLWAALVANLGLLGFFKYFGFVAQTARDVAMVLGLKPNETVLELGLPLGISFFTFQGLAYVVDLYRHQGKKAQSLLDFLLLIAFFPKLLAGPLVKSKRFLKQIADGPPEGMVDLPQAVSLIASGLFKKVVLATVLATRLVDDAFVAPENYSGGALFVAAIAYTVELYCDFSGYTDVARGIALFFGYRLPDNFNSPYSATDPGMFWNRWHISFSKWLREYIYFPMGGSKGSLPRTFLNLFVTFTICGLWHGATWGYILWGALHGVVLCIHKAVRNARPALGLVGREPWWWLGLGWFLTFTVVVLSRVLFKAGDLETAGVYFVRMFSVSAVGQGFDGWVVLATIIGFALNFVGRPLRRWFIQLHERIPTRFRPLFWVAVGMAILALQPGDIAPYIYFQF